MIFTRETHELKENKTRQMLSFLLHFVFFVYFAGKSSLQNQIMQNQKLNLTDTEKIPLETAEFVKTFGKTLIVAPHPDDESLGCGGAIALLRKFNLEVSILVLSDGTLSHPNSLKFPKGNFARFARKRVKKRS